MKALTLFYKYVTGSLIIIVSQTFLNFNNILFIHIFNNNNSNNKSLLTAKFSYLEVAERNLLAALVAVSEIII